MGGDSWPSSATALPVAAASISNMGTPSESAKVSTPGSRSCPALKSPQASVFSRCKGAPAVRAKFGEFQTSLMQVEQILLKQLQGKAKRNHALVMPVLLQ